MMTFGRVSEPWWHDHPVFIIGGGPSLKGRDLSRLRERGYVLGINRAADYWPCDATFTLDLSFIRNYRDQLAQWARDGQQVYLCVPDDHAEEPIPGAIYLRRVPGVGMAQDSGCIANGLNSGYGGLNVVFHKDAREAYLLGFDMLPIPDGKPTHWHESYPWNNRNSIKYFGRWAQKFDQAFSDCTRAGLNVYNAYPKSGITSFPFRSYEELGL